MCAASYPLTLPSAAGASTSPGARGHGTPTRATRPSAAQSSLAATLRRPTIYGARAACSPRITSSAPPPLHFPLPRGAPFSFRLPLVARRRCAYGMPAANYTTARGPWKWTRGVYLNASAMQCEVPAAYFGRPPPLATWHALLILLPLVARGRYRQPIWATTLSPRPPTTGSSRALRARSRSMTRHRYGISGYLAPSMAFHDFHRPACLHATPTHADGVRGGGATARSVVSPIWICPPRPGRRRR